jgi:hypothetical protein
MNRTGAFRQFISKATRLKLPGGLLTTGRVRQRGMHTKIPAGAGCKATIAAMQAK